MLGGRKRNEPRRPQGRDPQLLAVEPHRTGRARPIVDEGFHVHLKRHVLSKNGKRMVGKGDDRNVVEDAAHRLIDFIELVPVAP